MNGRRAKRIRREVYGDYSLRARDYFEDRNGACRCAGKRALYQHEKFLYKKMRRWCNGNTPDCQSGAGGSNPASAALFEREGLVRVGE